MGLFCLPHWQKDGWQPSMAHYEEKVLSDAGDGGKGVNLLNQQWAPRNLSEGNKLDKSTKMSVQTDHNIGCWFSTT